MSALGYMGYVGWVVYQDRNPPPQNPPDPNKKTLVILGMSAFPSRAPRVTQQARAGSTADNG